jgi:signal transduction histidine kinase
MDLQPLTILAAGCLCLGAGLLAAAYHTVLYLYFKDRILLDYVVYLLCMAMFIFVHIQAEALILLQHQTELNSLFRRLNEGVQVLSFGTYINFGIQALGLPRDKRSVFYSLWVVLSVVLGIYIVATLTLNIQDIPTPESARAVIRMFIFSMCLAILWRFITMPKSRFQGLVLMGCCYFFICGLISFLINFTGKDPTTVGPVGWLYIGNMGDIIFFSTAMGYRLKKISDERQQAILQTAEEKEKRKEAVTEERNRIARDMHDDLGSGLSKIWILTEVAKTQFQESDKSWVSLERISTSSRELVDNLQNIIWVLNPKDDSLESLSSYIRDYAARFFELLNSQVVFVYPEEIMEVRLTDVQRRNVFLIVKETLNNIAKHARCRTVKISIEQAPGEIILCLQDDGIGFDSEQVRRFGNGLRNMKSRMQDIGGTYRLESAPGKGTLVRLTIPV